MSHEEIDPGLYDRRFELVPREGYSDKHWRPLIKEAIEKYCQNKDIALDLGCGSGTYFMPMLEEVYNLVLGLDISTHFLIYAKKRKQNLSLIQGDAHKVPLESESIDAVTSNLFEYVDRKVTVKEIHRILKTNGICIVLTPNKYSACRIPFNIAARLLRKKRDMNEASKNELLELFGNNGFELVESRMDDGLIWLPNFLDRLCGRRVYLFIEGFSKLFGFNPFSNMMLFVARKKEPGNVSMPQGKR